MTMPEDEKKGLYYGPRDSSFRSASEIRGVPEPQDDIRVLLQGQQDILQAWEDQKVSYEQLLRLSARQTGALVESLSRQSVWEEMKRWVYSEYSQDFFQRFDPGREPRFYTEITDEQERARWDASWQLARAVFIKKATSGFPDKYVENGELERLLVHQIERLYNEIPGARLMMEGYAWAIRDRGQVEISREDAQKRMERMRGKLAPLPKKLAKQLMGEREEQGWKSEKEEEEDRLKERNSELRKMELKIEKKLFAKWQLKDFLEISIWDCETVEDFEAFRFGLRKKQLGSNKQFQQAIRETSRKYRESSKEAEEFLGIRADAIAWNFFRVMNQIESSNSYYSHAGKRYYSVPGAIFSADFGGALHQNERFFWKIALGQNWGVFSRWGMTQWARIEEQIATELRRKGLIKETSDYSLIKFDEVVYEPAKKSSEYWSFERTDEEPDDFEKKERARILNALRAEYGLRQKHVPVKVIVRPPECYPVEACKSFLEENEIGGKTLLDCLADGKEISWNLLLEDAVAIWLFSKYNRAVKLQEYFNPGKPFEEQKPGWAVEWAIPLKETMAVRLGLEKTLGILVKRGKTRQTEGLLRKWAVYAATGGVKDVRKRQPTFNASSQDQAVIRMALKHRNVDFLKGNLRI
jgi:hypothetical protein